MEWLREEYPRPQFKRKDWMNLNGAWDFKFEEEAWQKIQVPFVFQSELSGIGTNRMCDRVTYRRRFEVPEEWEKERILLHFGAVDYECGVWVNGRFAGGHTGGNTGFSLDITEMLTWGEEEIRVEVFDPCRDETIPRGKQYWEQKPDAIWYTRTTGIWQTVWLEKIPVQAVRAVRFTPDVDKGAVQIDYRCDGTFRDIVLEIDINMEGTQVADVSLREPKEAGTVTVDVFHNMIFHTSTHHGGWCWSPENPKLFDVRLVLRQGEKILDEVESYFGMRKIETDGGMVWLNNRPFYQKLVLDQGYWKDSLMTAKCDEDFKKDILLAKEMGFNGCRKHQKTEDPRFLYWADKLGFAVWEEIGSCIGFSFEAVGRTMKEWLEVVERDYNHPCIVTWVPLNESWGVPFIGCDGQQQAFAQALYYQLKALDPTRLVVGNDGWEMVKTDICAIHNYMHGGIRKPQEQERFRKSLSTREEMLRTYTAGRKIHADGYGYGGEPVLLTEFGGISFDTGVEGDWGYTKIRTPEELEKEYGRILAAVEESECIFGFCYTQLTDVEQETNGLLTCDRKPKVNPEKIREINSRIAKTRVV